MEQKTGGIFSKRHPVEAISKIPSSRKTSFRNNIESKKNPNQVGDGVSGGASVSGVQSGGAVSNGAVSGGGVSAVSENVGAAASDIFNSGGGDRPRKDAFSKRSNTSLGLKTDPTTPRYSIQSSITEVESIESIESIKSKPEPKPLPKKLSKSVMIKKKDQPHGDVEEKPSELNLETLMYPKETEEETCEDPAEDPDEDPAEDPAEEPADDPAEDVLQENKDLSSIDESLSPKSLRLISRRSPHSIHRDEANLPDKGKQKPPGKPHTDKMTTRYQSLRKSPRKAEQKPKPKTRTVAEKDDSKSPARESDDSKSPAKKSYFSDPEQQASTRSNVKIKDEQPIGSVRPKPAARTTVLSNKVAHEPGDAKIQIKCLEALKLIEEKIDDDIKNSDQNKGGAMQGPLIDLNENYVKLLENLEIEKTELVSHIDVLNNKLKEAENKINTLEPRKNENIKECKKKLIEHQTLLKDKEKEIQKIKNINKSLEEHKKGVDMKNEILLRELSQCELRIDKYRSENDNLKKNIMQLQNKTNLEVEDEFRILYENERIQCEKLRNKVTEHLQQLDAMKSELEHVKEENTKAANDELTNELDNLKLKYEKLQLEKELLEVENQKLEAKPTHSDQKLMSQVLTLQSDLEEVKQRNEILNEMLEKAESKSNEKGISVEELDEITIKLKTEIDMLQGTVINLKHENEHLNTEIFRHKIEAKQMQETNFMNQRLLRIRGELIKYFHETKEKCSIHDIYPGLNKSGGVIDQDIYMQNSQIPIRINELQKLSSSLDNRDADLSKKNQVIKLLEDNEDRNRKAMIKLEDQNTRLELEVAELRRLLRMNSQASYL